MAKMQVRNHLVVNRWGHPTGCPSHAIVISQQSSHSAHPRGHRIVMWGLFCCSCRRPSPCSLCRVLTPGKALGLGLPAFPRAYPFTQMEGILVHQGQCWPQTGAIHPCGTELREDPGGDHAPTSLLRSTEP